MREVNLLLSDADFQSYMRFSQSTSWNPRFSPDLVRRFLTELISTKDLIFEVRDSNGLAAAASLIDKIRNPFNDAWLEILGIRDDVDAQKIIEKMVEWARSKIPKNRSGFQISVKFGPRINESFIATLGLHHNYDTYDMKAKVPKELTLPAPEVFRAGVNEGKVVYDVMTEAMAKNPEASIPELDSWLKRFSNTPSLRYFLWKQDGQAVGFAGLNEIEKSKLTEVHTLGVLPQARGKGVGAKLLHHCLAESCKLGAKECQLTVAALNVKALKIYENAGFKVISRQHTYRWQRP